MKIGSMFGWSVPGADPSAYQQPEQQQGRDDLWLKKIFGVYLAKLDAPDSEAYTRLELPEPPVGAARWMDKVQLQEKRGAVSGGRRLLRLRVSAPRIWMEQTSAWNELNELARQLTALDEVQGIAFEGLLSMEVQKKISTNGGIITLQDLRNLAASAKNRLLSYSGCRR